MAYGARMQPSTTIERPSRFGGLVFVAAFAAVMWLVEIVDLVAGDLDSAGIVRARSTAWSAWRSHPCCTEVSAT